MTARPQTALAAAMNRAGLNTAKARLYQLAIDALRKHRAAPDRGFSVFEQSAEDDPDLVREALAEFYQRRDAEMSGAGLTSSDNHTSRASARHDGGQGALENQTINAADANGVSPSRNDSHIKLAHPVREPSAAERSIAARIANTIAVSIMDTFKVRDGRSIGDVRYGELRRMMGANAREAAVIRQILDHADAPHDVRVRDVIKTEHLQRFVQRAAEIVDAAK